jgi:hypothetical protein
MRPERIIMDTRKFTARKEKWLHRELQKWLDAVHLNPGERICLSGQITPGKLEAKVVFYQRNTTSPVIDKRVSKATLAKIGRMTDFNEGQQRIVNILLSSGNQPTTRRDLADRGCQISHIDQINGILRKKNISVAIRSPKPRKGDDTTGLHWHGPICFRYVDRSVKD